MLFPGLVVLLSCSILAAAFTSSTSTYSSSSRLSTAFTVKRSNAANKSTLSMMKNPFSGAFSGKVYNLLLLTRICTLYLTKIPIPSLAGN